MGKWSLVIGHWSTGKKNPETRSQIPDGDIPSLRRSLSNVRPLTVENSSSGFWTLVSGFL